MRRASEGVLAETGDKPGLEGRRGGWREGGDEKTRPRVYSISSP